MNGLSGKHWLFLVVAFIVAFRLWILLAAEAGIQFHDFDLLYYAAKHLLRGENPYPIATTWYPWPLFYPMPAVLMVVPFTPLSLTTAQVLFDISSGVIFAYALWRFKGPYALLAVLSGSYLFAQRYSQFTPLLVAAALIPSLGGLLTVKPNIGLALWLARPNRSAVLGGLALVALSFIVLPSWPLDWFRALHEESTHLLPPVMRPFGFLLLLSALRWRTPEGRLFLALSLLPQNTQPHDLVPLALIPVNLTEMGIYLAGSWVALAATAKVALALPPITPQMAVNQTVEQIWLPILLSVYLPMLWLVLRRKPEERPTEPSLSAS